MLTALLEVVGWVFAVLGTVAIVVVLLFGTGRE